jgi:hypothetical protein
MFFLQCFPLQMAKKHWNFVLGSKNAGNITVGSLQENQSIPMAIFTITHGFTMNT